MTLPFPAQSSLPDLLASIALLSALMLVGWITRRALKARADLPPQAARRWSANIRNALLLVAMVGLLMIWAPQLRTFALSLTAVAVAVVVATKELILCLSGSAFRTFNRAYTIGDIIEIGEYRGEVLDINLLASRLREVDRREGSIRLLKQTAVVPHSLLFSTPVRIVARAGSLPEHVFSLVFETKLNLFSRLEEIEAAARSAYDECAARSNSDEPEQAVAVTVTIKTTELGRQKLEFAFRSRLEDAATIENVIAAAVGSWVMSQNEGEIAAET
ncbi:mechanosensitive ion channel family protein [Erythrobacter sp. NFXS35]|uniref:mechanosensitive ion channel family protein n=1 Tax=Erythrobacter sp. NFXS35 TaxID=2818436 RepID=UPI0032DFE062